MKESSITRLLFHPISLMGLIFFLINAYTSYEFYHVNSYKIVITAIGVTILSIISVIWRGMNQTPTSWGKRWLFLLIPIIVTSPGLFLHGLNYNYNFQYELISYLVVILWAICLMSFIHNQDQLSQLFYFIGITIIFTALWGILEKVGYHPLDWGAVGVSRVKSTFGNINYYAGFLITLLPLVLVLALPGYSSENKKSVLTRFQFEGSNAFFLFALIFGITGLILTQTRAAIMGWGAGTGLTVYLVAVLFAPRVWKKRLIIILAVLVTLSIAASVVMIIFADQFEGSRFAALFTLKAWYSRLSPWQAALNAIKSSPVIGYGLGSSYNLFFSFVPGITRLYWPERSFNHAHSEPIEFIQEAGLLGFIGYLFFWGFIFLSLIKVIRSNEQKLNYKRIAVGIIGGLVAYHIHSFFSVAPRMMVVKLPVFTLVGLTLALRVLLPSSKPDSRVSDLKSIGIKGVPVIIALIVIWSLGIPWFSTQNRFVGIMKQPNSFVKVQRLEKLVNDRADIYALDYLAKLELEYKRPAKLKKTLAQIGDVIPHYRDTDLLHALQASLEQNPQKALELALQTQAIDTYHLPTIEFLMNLSVATNNTAEFETQLKYLIKFFAFQNQLVPSEDAFINQFRQFIQTQILNSEPLSLTSDEDILKINAHTIMGQPIDFLEDGDFLIINVDANLVKILFTKARQVRLQGSFTKKDKLEFWSALMRTLVNAPYFKLELFSPDDALATAQVNQTLEKYVAIRNQQDQESKQLQNDYIRELRRSGQSSQKKIKNKYDHMKKDKAEEFEKTTRPLITYLEANCEWKEFERKQGFLKSVADNVTKIVFPDFIPH